MGFWRLEKSLETRQTHAVNVWNRPQTSVQWTFRWFSRSKNMAEHGITIPTNDQTALDIHELSLWSRGMLSYLPLEDGCRGLTIKRGVIMWYIYIYVLYIDLEPKWPLFLNFNSPKQDLFQPKQGSFGLQGHIHVGLSPFPVPVIVANEGLQESPLKQVRILLLTIIAGKAERPMPIFMIHLQCRVHLEPHHSNQEMGIDSDQTWKMQGKWNDFSECVHHKKNGPKNKLCFSTRRHKGWSMSFREHKGAIKCPWWLLLFLIWHGMAGDWPKKPPMDHWPLRWCAKKHWKLEVENPGNPSKCCRFRCHNLGLGGGWKMGGSNLLGGVTSLKREHVTIDAFCGDIED